MSPEQVRGKEIDTRTDLFSFGAVLYEMCTGVLPFRGETSGVIFKAILDATPTPPARVNPEIPPELERIIAKALEKDRGVRCQSAAELCADLKRLKRDTTSGTTEVLPRAVEKGRFRWSWAVAAALLILAVVGGAVRLKSPTSPPRVTAINQLTNDNIGKVSVLTDAIPSLYHGEDFQFPDRSSIDNRRRDFSDTHTVLECRCRRHFSRSHAIAGSKFSGNRR